MMTFIIGLSLSSLTNKPCLSLPNLKEIQIQTQCFHFHKYDLDSVVVTFLLSIWYGAIY